jgi:hypothetical protein
LEQALVVLVAVVLVVLRKLDRQLQEPQISVAVAVAVAWHPISLTNILVQAAGQELLSLDTPQALLAQSALDLQVLQPHLGQIK